MAYTSKHICRHIVYTLGVHVNSYSILVSSCLYFFSCILFLFSAGSKASLFFDPTSFNPAISDFSSLFHFLFCSDPWNKCHSGIFRVYVLKLYSFILYLVQEVKSRVFGKCKHIFIYIGAIWEFLLKLQKKLHRNSHPWPPVCKPPY